MNFNEAMLSNIWRRGKKGGRLLEDIRGRGRRRGRGGGRETERQRETETERDRDRERQRQRATETERYRDRDRKRESILPLSYVPVHKYTHGYPVLIITLHLI